MTGRRDDDAWTVDDLRREDLPAIIWSGSASHLRNVAHQLDRADAGTLEYLVVRDRDGNPVCKGAVDYEERPSAGTILQLATRDDLQRRGLATLLVGAAEQRIRRRGLLLARLSVEPDNEVAVRLYERLAYRPVGERRIGWEHEPEPGVIGWYETDVIDMEKRLADPAASD